MNIPPLQNSMQTQFSLGNAGRDLQLKKSTALEFPLGELNSNALVEQNSAGELKEAFTDFVGQTLFSEMIKAARETQQKPAYLHGGRAEEIFQGQLDQALSEELSDASAGKVADPMFELFMLKRQS